MVNGLKQAVDHIAAQLFANLFFVQHSVRSCGLNIYMIAAPNLGVLLHLHLPFPRTPDANALCGLPAAILKNVSTCKDVLAQKGKLDVS